MTKIRWMKTCWSCDRFWQQFSLNKFSYLILLYLNLIMNFLFAFVRSFLSLFMHTLTLTQYQILSRPPTQVLWSVAIWILLDLHGECPFIFFHWKTLIRKNAFNKSEMKCDDQGSLFCLVHLTFFPSCLLSSLESPPLTKQKTAVKCNTPGNINLFQVIYKQHRSF